MRDHFIEGRRYDSCVTVTIYHGVRDRFIEPLKALSKGRKEQKGDSSCADCVPVYHGMRDRFIEGQRHDSCVTVTIYHGVCDHFIEPLKAPSKARIEQKGDMRRLRAHLSWHA